MSSSSLPLVRGQFFSFRQNGPFYCFYRRALLFRLQERRLLPDSKVETYPADPRSKTIKLSDAAVSRSLRSVRDSVVYGARVHCLVWPRLRPSGVHPMWCWRDTRVRALKRLCRQVLCTLSVVLVLVWLLACEVQEIGSVSFSASSLVRKWLPVGLLGDDFRKLSSYSRQSTEPFRGGLHISCVKVGLGSRGCSWVALLDEYGLSTVQYISRSLACACSPERYSSRIFLPGDDFRRHFHLQYFLLGSTLDTHSPIRVLDVGCSFARVFLVCSGSC